jgi:hypothetical protein
MLSNWFQCLLKKPVSVSVPHVTSAPANDVWTLKQPPSWED